METIHVILYMETQTCCLLRTYTPITHLLVGLEDVATKSAAGELSGDVAEYLHVLGVVGHVEYPALTSDRETINIT